MESLESTHRELDATSERLRTVEAQRIASAREAESLRHRLEQAEQLGRSLQAGLRQRWVGRREGLGPPDSGWWRKGQRGTIQGFIFGMRKPLCLRSSSICCPMGGWP